MLIHSSRKVIGSTLELSVDGSQVEHVRSFVFLGVTTNDTLTRSDHVNTVLRRLSLLVSSSTSSSLPYI